ncbi:MAG: MMPL family transporter [Deltaproteobacteria bacterium]|nr:MMPL family transporter [Deltaproteobacteria bacterium]
MKNILGKLDLFFEKTPDHLRWNKFKLWVFYIFLLLVVSYGMKSVQLDNSMESFLNEDDPTKLSFDQFREAFGSDEGIYLVYKPKDGNVFSSNSLNSIRNLQNELLERAYSYDEEIIDPLNQISDITSLINVRYLEVKGDLLTAREFIGQNNPTNLREMENLRHEAKNHPDYLKLFLSEDSKYGGFMINTDLGMEIADELDESQETEVWDGKTPKVRPPKRKLRKTPISMAEYSAFYNELKAVLEKPEYKNHLEFYAVGIPVIMSFFNEVVMDEMGILFTATLAVMLLVLAALFRSFSAMIWPMCVVVISIIMTLGVLGWIGMPMNMMINILILLIMVVGVADSVHIISGYSFYRRKNLGHEEALRATYKKSGLACLLTSLTTAIGMLSLVFVQIPPIQVFGISAAIGVMFAFIVTIFVLPLFLNDWNPFTTLPPEQLKLQNQREGFTQRLIRETIPLSLNNPYITLGSFAFIVLVFAYGVSLVRVDSNNLDILKDGSPIKTAYQLVDKVMGGTDSAEIFLDLRETDAMKDPQVLNALDQAQAYLDKSHKNKIGMTYSLANVVKSSYQALNQNKLENYIIPQEKQVLEQTLLLFENTSSGELQKLVSDDFSQGRLTIRFYNTGSSEFVGVVDEIKKELHNIFEPLRRDYPELKFEITGSVALKMKMVDLMSWAQVKSFTLALLVITVLLLFVFGSLKAGLIGIIPNVIPAVVTFGAMGFLDIPLDTDTLIIAPIIIGVSVDDTIHFLTHFRAYRLQGMEIKDALSHTIKEVGQAVSFTSLILIAGFFLLVISQHQGLVRFGYFTALAFSVAWVCDLFLLPALCQVLKIQFPARKELSVEL